MEFQLIALCAASLLAGFVDAIAGGGGLIQLPALFLFLPTLAPGVAPAVILGTNKLSSACGTTYAVMRYSRAVPIAWRVVLPAAFFAALFSYLGASSVRMFSPQAFQSIIIILLFAVAGFTILKKDLGTGKRRVREGIPALITAIIIGSFIGFYDGFFGPGTGSFLIIAFVTIFGTNFLTASASSKIVNLITNVFALIFFILHGTILYKIGFIMAVSNIIGAFLGTHVAIKKGSAFVRIIFIVVVFSLIAKLVWAMFSP